MHGGAVGEWADPCAQSLLIDVYDEIEAKFVRTAIAEGDHLLKLPGGVHVEERKRRLRPARTLSAQGAASPSCPCRWSKASPVCRMRGDFAHDVDAFRLELGEMARLRSSRRRHPLTQ